MEISYDTLLEHTIEALNRHKIWVLSTSAHDRVTARSMSIVNDGLSIYFQTHTSYIKYQQIEQNKHVALCYNNIQIEGEAIIRGNAFNGQNETFLALYQRDHEGSYQKYTKLEKQVVIEVQPKKVTYWKYIDKVPYKEILDLVNETAVREMQEHIA
jgi:general stress protein 26